jgi:hypothetical protein
MGDPLKFDSFIDLLLPAGRRDHALRGAYAQAPVKEAMDRYVRVATCPNCLPG